MIPRPQTSHGDDQQAPSGSPSEASKPLSLRLLILSGRLANVGTSLRRASERPSPSASAKMRESLATLATSSRG